jgi:HlyD family secretion protein
MIQMNKVSLMKKKLSHIKRPFVWFRRTRRRNKVFVLIGLCILFFIILGQIQSATAKPPYVTEKAKRTTITEYVSETGNVNSAGRFDVYSSTTGIIEELYVDNNTVVEHDDPLFKARSTATDQEKSTAYASYQSALSALKTAEQSQPTYDAQMWAAQQALLEAKNTQNYKNDHSKNPATGQDYTELEKESIDTAAVQAEKNFRALEKKTLESNSSVTAAQAQVNATSLAYQATLDIIVKAPAGGTVTNLSSKVGDKVSIAAAQSVTTPMSPVLSIANLNDYSVRLALNEIDVPKVAPGQKAIITLDAFSGKKFRGTVTHVDALGTNTQGVVTYAVMLDIANPDNKIKPGMTANIDIEVDKAENVLSVPNSAVKPYKGARAVRVIDPETKGIKYMPVTIGIKGDDRTEIIKGISENQEIIVSLPNDQVERSSPF